MLKPKHLYILWTNDDFHTSNLMVMMYAYNSMLHRLWNSVTVIIWGATVKLAAENEMIQEQLKIAQHVEAKFSACISCARQFGVVEKLEELGIEVKPWVEPFTELVQNGETIIYV
jgi:hypothetical protein